MSITIDRLSGPSNGRERVRITVDLDVKFGPTLRAEPDTGAGKRVEVEDMRWPGERRPFSMDEIEAALSRDELERRQDADDAIDEETWRDR